MPICVNPHSPGEEVRDEANECCPVVMQRAAWPLAAAEPSRAALMTGRYSSRASLTAIISGGTRNTLQPGETAPCKLSQGRGYAPAIEGKWHLGASEQSCPTRQGFDECRVGVIDTPDGPLVSDGDAARGRARGRDRGWGRADMTYTRSAPF